MPNQNMVKSALIVVWSLILTSITFVMGAIPLNALRKSTKGWVYWTVSLSISVALLALEMTSLSIAYASLSVLMGLLVEFEKKGLSVFLSSILSILTTLSVQLLALGAWIKTTQPESVYEALVAQVQLVVDKLAESNSSITITAEQLVSQLPSGLLMILISACALAIIFEKKVMAWQGILIVRKERLTDFKLPEVLIWFFMASMAGAFFKHEIQWLEVFCINAFNVGVLLYFFQGLAVMVAALKVLKFGVFWRALILALFVVQLFPVVSGIGVMDLWLDFRKKLLDRVKKLNNK